MPSVAEPCGLSQMLAMRSGTIPVVRETGGLKDSVQPYDPSAGTGTGFTFQNIDRRDMLDALSRAVALWREDKTAWQQLMRRAMTADFTWDRSAGHYIEIYRSLTGQEA